MSEPSEVFAAFGAQVSAARRAQNMSQAELAVASGIDRVSISRVERGLQDLGVVRLTALATALGCTPASLLRDGGQTSRPD